MIGCRLKPQTLSCLLRRKCTVFQTIAERRVAEGRRSIYLAECEDPVYPTDKAEEEARNPCRDLDKLVRHRTTASGAPEQARVVPEGHGLPVRVFIVLSGSLAGGATGFIVRFGGQFVGRRGVIDGHYLDQV